MTATSPERARTWLCASVAATLSITAAIAIAFGLWLACGESDTEPMESPLLLSVASQLERGPWKLYGPFGRQNPLVLIHAPLYYHLGALLTWPLARTGVDSITAARLTGRALSFLGLLLTALCAFWIARLDKGPPRAGWWAACLVAAAPVVGTTPFTVRPDMLGVGLQTAGVLLVLRALFAHPTRGAMLCTGFAAFGLAISFKQHLAGGFAVATLLLLGAWWRDRVSLRLVGLAVLSTLVIVAIVYGIEELATEGRMSEALFIAAPATARVHPTDWTRTAIILTNVAGGNLCLIALVSCAGLARVASEPGIRRVLRIAGTALAGLALFMPIVEQLWPSFNTSLTGIVSIFVCLFVVIPACLIIDRCFLFGSWLDVLLFLFTAGELFIVVPLFRASTGAWVNYAIQGTVFAAILAARALSRAFDQARLIRSLVPLAVVPVVLLGIRLKDDFRTFRDRRLDQLEVQLCLDYLKNAKASELYFAGSPARTRATAAPSLSSTTGSTRYSRLFTLPRRGRHGSGVPLPTARFDSSSPLPKTR